MSDKSNARYIRYRAAKANKKQLASESWNRKCEEIEKDPEAALHKADIATRKAVGAAMTNPLLTQILCAALDPASPERLLHSIVQLVVQTREEDQMISDDRVIERVVRLK